MTVGIELFNAEGKSIGNPYPLLKFVKKEAITNFREHFFADKGDYVIAYSGIFTSSIIGQDFDYVTNEERLRKESSVGCIAYYFEPTYNNPTIENFGYQEFDANGRLVNSITDGFVHIKGAYTLPELVPKNFYSETPWSKLVGDWEIFNLAQTGVYALLLPQRRFHYYLDSSQYEGDEWLECAEDFKTTPTGFMRRRVFQVIYNNYWVAPSVVEKMPALLIDVSNF